MCEDTKACRQGLSLPQQVSLALQEVHGGGHLPMSDTFASLASGPAKALMQPSRSLPAQPGCSCGRCKPPLPLCAFGMGVRRHDPSSSPQTARPHLVELEVQPLQLGQVGQVAPHQVSQLQPLLLTTLPGGQDSSMLRQAALGPQRHSMGAWQGDAVESCSRIPSGSARS